jgi:hypothetical protein
LVSIEGIRVKSCLSSFTYEVDSVLVEMMNLLLKLM